MKIIAKLKEVPTVTSTIDFDFSKDFITGSTILEETKRKLLYELKKSLSEKITMLSLDDVDFKSPSNL